MFYPNNKTCYTIKSWTAEVIYIENDSKKFASKKGYQEVTAVKGRLRLKPELTEKNEVTFTDGTVFSLDTFFRDEFGMANKEQLVHTVKAGDIILVSGDISEAFRPIDEATTYLSLEEWVFDYSKGKVDPFCSQLLTSDTVEFFEAANMRFSEVCSFCNNITEEIAIDSLRYCPTCDI